MLVVVLGALASLSAHAANLYVSTSGNDTTGTGTTAAPYLTVAKAVAVANSGDAINIDAGTYTEAGTITFFKPLTLQNWNAGTPPIVQLPGAGTVFSLGAGADGTTFKGLNIVLPDIFGSFAIAINTNAAFNGLTLDTMHLTGPGNGSGNLTIGLLGSAGASVSNLTVKDSFFVGLNEGWQFSAVGGTAIPGCIIPAKGTGGTLNGVTVTNTQFNNNSNKGIYVEMLSNAVFDRVSMDHNGGGVGASSNAAPQGSGLDINLKAGDYSNITIKNSTFTNNALTNDSGGAILIKARDDRSYACSPATLDNVTIVDNTITGNERGIRFGESMRNNALPSVLAYNAGPTNVTVQYNVIANNVPQYSGAAPDQYGGVLDSTLSPSIHINRNDLHGNGKAPGQLNGIVNPFIPDTAVPAKYTTNNLVDGTCNYWGAADGPAASSAPNTNPSGAVGSGDMVSDGVTYKPFLISNVLTGACGPNVAAGAATVTLTKQLNGPSAGYDPATTFPVTVTCSVQAIADPAGGTPPPVVTSATVNLVPGAAQSVPVPPTTPTQTSTCSVSEGALPNPLAGFVYGTMPTIAPASFAAPATATDQAVTITNPISPIAPGTLTVSKVVSGGPAPAGGSYSINVSCSGTASVYNQTQNVTAGGSINFTGIVPAVATTPASCTVQEQAPLPTAPSGYSWAAIPTAETLSVASDASAAVTVTNTLTAIPAGTLTVSKVVSGGPAPVGGSYSINVSCSGAASAYNQTQSVAAGGSVAFTGIVPAVASAPASCTVQEQALLPTAPSGYAWGPIPTAQTQSVASGASAAVTVTNTLTAIPAGTLTVSKSVSGGPAPAGGSYSINVACSGTASNYNQTLTVAAGGSVDFTGIVPAVASAPATCTVQEQAPLPTPPTSYVWAAIPTAKTVSIAGGGTGSVNIVNTLTQTISGMTVNVTITGGPASYSASFPISVACTLSSAAVSGITPTSPANIGAGPGTAIGTQVFSNIPQGASCTISQGSLPTAPTGYHWGTPVITQLGSAISSLGPQGQMGGSTRGAAGAASNVASVVNPLIVDAPPPPPPPPATPAPALSGWAQMLAMLLLLGCGVCQVRARHNDG